MHVACSRIRYACAHAHRPRHRRQPRRRHGARSAVLAARHRHAARRRRPTTASRCSRASAIDLVIQDMNFRADTTSGEEGVALFRAIRERHPDLPVILLTAWTHLDVGGRPGQGRRRRLPRQAVGRPQAARHGAATCSSSAQASRELQRRAQRRAPAQRELAQRLRPARRWCSPTRPRERVLALACQVARADVPVLITGPNGAGKETHRRDHPGQLGGARRPVRRRSTAARCRPS